MLHKSTLNNVKTNKIEGLSKRRYKDGKFEFHKQTIFPVCILILALRLTVSEATSKNNIHEEQEEE